MEIVVEGWRAGGEERKEAASVPTSKLPPLSDEQKLVAKKMGIPEEDYARSAYAGKRNQDRLIDKTKRFIGFLEPQLRNLSADAQIIRVRLVTIEHEYRIELSVSGRSIYFRLPEEMVDDFVEGGSSEVGRQIANRLETVVTGRAA